MVRNPMFARMDDNAMDPEGFDEPGRAKQTRRNGRRRLNRVKRVDPFLLKLDALVLHAKKIYQQRELKRRSDSERAREAERKSRERIRRIIQAAANNGEQPRHSKAIIESDDANELGKRLEAERQAYFERKKREARFRAEKPSNERTVFKPRKSFRLKQVPSDDFDAYLGDSEQGSQFVFSAAGQAIASPRGRVVDVHSPAGFHASKHRVKSPENKRARVAFNRSAIRANSNFLGAKAKRRTSGKCKPRRKLDQAIETDTKLTTTHVIALYDFDALELGDLEFRKGDIIRVIERTEENGWWFGESLRTKEQGSIPSNFVRPYANPNGMVDFDSEKRQYELENQAARRIQKAQRARKQRQRSRDVTRRNHQSPDETFAATKIQSLHRGRKVRKTYEETKTQLHLENELVLNHAATRIQALSRGKLARRGQRGHDATWVARGNGINQTEEDFAARKIQTAFKQSSPKRLLVKKQENEAATKIQNRYRSRMRHWEQANAARSIQNQYRSKVKRVQDNAAKSIQDQYRLNVKRRHNAAAKKIQNRYRTKIIQEQNMAASKIQRKFRANRNDDNPPSTTRDVPTSQVRYLSERFTAEAINSAMAELNNARHP